ncbi:MAG TPA: PEP/pyruvate-binding domain-containing protein [Kiritimatiellia bacterium]|nr:PEP/pyruvate-binding domain-containing protein [Kiritimatiellia bacterium]
MAMMDCTTGLPGLDRVLKGVMPGDNVVWQIEEVDDYRDLVLPYALAACQTGRRLIYFRFARHEQLIPESSGPEIYHPDPTLGFERFVDAVHQVITDVGSGAIYVFDCLSDLASDWQSDAMLGNFFMLTCPRLLDYQSLTYFALYRNHHSHFASKPIEETCQFMLDVFRRDGRMHIRPLKVQYRSTSVMNTIHVREGDDFIPVNSSAEISGLLSSLAWAGLNDQGPLDVWHRTFGEARSLPLTNPTDATGQHSRLFHQILEWLISGDERIIRLANTYFTLDDLMAIYNRMIGIGSIGGKAVGMLLARAIVNHHDKDLANRLEAHDSFYLGTELYYTFLVRNRVWWIRQRQREPSTFLGEIQEARELIFHGTFPDHVIQRLREMLEYFGESPYIVRSSSLLEDAYGNAFAGQYESVFCVNQGPLDARLQDLLNAIRRVYASALSENALRYRQRRGLLNRDEQMALLIMRVSGSSHKRFFYPHLAGVGLSYNPYAWNPDIDPNAGVIRLVFGLGTRAVDRADDDNTRLVALNKPLLRPESTVDEIHQASQRKMDCLDLVENKLISGWVDDLAAGDADIPFDRIADIHPENRRWLLTFNPLLRDTGFTADIRRILKLLSNAYECPIDIEFAVNIIRGDDYRINLLQCRPLQIRSDNSNPAKENASGTRVLLQQQGPVIGASRRIGIDTCIVVDPSAYARLGEQQRHAVARAIGRINQSCGKEQRAVLLIGPGRWGTRQPSLGIPVRFGEINHMLAVCEWVTMHEKLVPDASLGTHFLSELIESDMLYFVLDTAKSGNVLDLDALASRPNRLAELSPDCKSMEYVIRVVGIPDYKLEADMLRQCVVLSGD